MPYAVREDRVAAQRRHYDKNRTVMIARAKEGKIKARAQLKDVILEYLKEHPCVDCGEGDPVVLEFDHRDGADKKFNLGEAMKMAFGVKTVLAEIAKCDVRCANCHRRRTYRQMGFSHRG